MIVRWGLESLPEVIREAGAARPLLIASTRWKAADLPVEVTAHWAEVPSERIG